MAQEQAFTCANPDNAPCASLVLHTVFTSSPLLVKVGCSRRFSSETEIPGHNATNRFRCERIHSCYDSFVGQNSEKDVYHGQALKVCSCNEKVQALLPLPEAGLKIKKSRLSTRERLLKEGRKQ